MRCAGCGAVVASAWFQTGLLLDQRVPPRRVALIGPEARSDQVLLLGDSRSPTWPQQVASVPVGGTATAVALAVMAVFDLVLGLLLGGVGLVLLAPRLWDSPGRRCSPSPVPRSP